MGIWWRSKKEFIDIKRREKKVIERGEKNEKIIIAKLKIKIET